MALIDEVYEKTEKRLTLVEIILQNLIKENEMKYYWARHYEKELENLKNKHLQGDKSIRFRREVRDFLNLMKQKIRNKDITNAKGKIKICTKCNVTKDIEVHHVSYEKPNEFIFLCRKCHIKEHSISLKQSEKDKVYK